MSSTHLSLQYHLIFSTKHRRAWIKESCQAQLYSYLGGVLRGLGGVAEIIGGDADHVHVLASLKATHRLADVMRELKSSSSHYVREAIGIHGFGWQDGYGAFTVGRSEIEWIKRYIHDQREHHRRKTFQEEYLEILRQNGIEFDERFLW